MNPPLKLWVAGARPRTLPAAVVPVLVGTAVGYQSSGRFLLTTPQLTSSCHTAVCATFVRELNWLNALLALLVALGIQVGTNYVNDYADGVRGTDEHRVGPVRLVAGKLATVRQVKSAALFAFGVAGIAGLILAARVTWWFIPLGLLCGVAGWAYTGGPQALWLPGPGRGVRLRLLRAGGDRGLGLRPARTVHDLHLWPPVRLFLRLGLRVVGRRPRRTAGGGAPRGEQRARSGDGHRSGKEDAGRAPRAAWSRRPLHRNADGRSRRRRHRGSLRGVGSSSPWPPSPSPLLPSAWP